MITLNFVICSLIITGYFVSTTGVPEVIQAKSFEVVNDEGKVVAAIYADANGGVLGVSNKDGKQVAGIGVDADGDGVVKTNDSKGVETSRMP